MPDTLKQRQRLYDSIKDVKDEFTRNVLYSQFIDKYYGDAFDSIQNLFGLGQIHKTKNGREQGDMKCQE